MTYLSCMVTWSQNSTLTAEDQEISVKIYPNPAKEFITIETNQFPTSAAFVDSQGKIHGFIPIKAQRSKINIEGFNSGKYYILIKNRKHSLLIK